MKRILLFLLLVAILAGCGSAATTTQQTTQAQPIQPKQSTQPTPAPTYHGGVMVVGQTGQFNGWNVTLVSARASMDYQIEAEDQNPQNPTDAQHHHLTQANPPFDYTLVRASLVVCHVRITNVSSQDGTMKATFASSYFSVQVANIPEGNPNGYTGQISYTPYNQKDRIDTYVPIGASTEGDVVADGGPGYPYLLVFDEGNAYDPNILRWQFTV